LPSLVKVRKWLFNRLNWSFEEGDMILIEIDHIQGMKNDYNLASDLIDTLHLRGFTNDYLLPLDLLYTLHLTGFIFLY